MEDDILTVDQVAAKLDLHPKTIRRFIQEGRLKAQKVGKQWRITGTNLNEFIGSKDNDNEVMEIPDKTVPCTTYDGTRPKIQVSAVVDLIVENNAEAIRVTNTLFALMNCKDPSYGYSRCDHIFYKEEMKARYILWGSPGFITDILSCLTEITRSKEES